MWLSNRDLLQIMDRSLRAPLPGWAVANAMSANGGMAFDLAGTRALLGYEPEDDVTRHPRPGTPGPDFRMELTVRP